VSHSDADGRTWSAGLAILILYIAVLFVIDMPRRKTESRIADHEQAIEIIVSIARCTIAPLTSADDNV
jgi:hypothetical protein